MYGQAAKVVSNTSSLPNGVINASYAFIVAIRFIMPDIAYLMLLVGIVLGRLLSLWVDRKR